MLNSLHHDLHALGGLARSSRLTALGHRRTAVETAVAEGWLFRPCRPWVATRGATRDMVIAVLNRGMLTGATALRSYGIWAGVDRDIHLLLRPNAKPTPMTSAVPLANFAVSRSSDTVVRHWREATTTHPIDVDWRASVTDSIIDFAHNALSEHVIAAIDSALHLKLLTPSSLPILGSRLPPHHRSQLTRANSRAEAGTESLARLRIESMGFRAEVQMWIGSNRVDLLVDGWLVIEIDSEEWHGKDRLRDSRRTNWLIAHGYRVLRFDYVEVMDGWPSCEATIREALRVPPLQAPRIPARDRRQ